MNTFRNLIIISIFFCVLIIISNISFADESTSTTTTIETTSTTTTIESTTSSSSTTTTIQIPTCDLTVPTDDLTFGSLKEGEKSGVLTKSVVLDTNTYAVVKIYGTDWSYDSKSMDITQTKYQNDWTSGDPTESLQSTPTELFTSSVDVSHVVGFQVVIPNTQPAGNYHQTITFDFICGETPA